MQVVSPPHIRWTSCRTGHSQSWCRGWTAILGPVEVLVNVAGVGVAAPLPTTSSADWNRIFAVNVTAMFLSCRAVLPGMLERGHCIIVNISSIARVVAVRERAAYTASKHAVVGLTRSVAADYAAPGIRANVLWLARRGRRGVAFLVSDGGRFMNGSAMVMDGGISAV